MKDLTLLVIASFCLVSPAGAQSRVYTNADLGKPITTTRTPTAEEMQGLIARQFTRLPREEGAQLIVLPYDPDWPFTYSRRLEMDPWRTPGGLPFFGVWPFYGYAPNTSFVRPPRPFAPFGGGADRARSLSRDRTIVRPPPNR
jgi:hypothetical protein